ncbi:biotin-independent malonate decarboxylase subunit beta [Legionella parisiensis]|uniref:Malonate decarboxylase acyl carrier protein n=1 Tax=Legionella parisiensis TaxID=45071 RepID=A0A1E5JTB4_9GAMM|nr:biotin-independent malonate decarboxylase subunit beta [Legionella parisiensis]KTD40361.1 malonate decarboxylase subunit delta [Legionella parisiensis]OEH47769.1 Malonyl-S-ACP:biotin-protein carboxyltransferase MADC [Legionella parisiensis]STX77205.1 malonate decarboxylase subunit delta [Legionella parisiensis]
MEKMEFRFTLPGERLQGKKTVCGVVGSGNLEVIIEENTTSETIFTIQTAIDHYKTVWKMIIDDFVNQHQPVGLQFTLNDNGAIPAVVLLRLSQALEEFQGNHKIGSNYEELDARERIQVIFDKDSFTEWLAEEKLYSPYLAALNLPGEADDGIVIGSALLQKSKVLVAAQQKDFMGGAVGEIHGAKLTGLFKAAIATRAKAVILLIDSGGVRLHEANAGEISISETIRAVFDARRHGVTTVGVICGKNGAFGGMGIISACLDYLVINEVGRIGISGPEVIQAVAGVTVFNSQDRALVWRVYGGKTRYLQDIAQSYVGADVGTLRAKLIAALDKSVSLDLNSIKQKHALLKKRLQETQGFQEQGAYLKQVAPKYAATLFDMDEQDFLDAAKNIKKKS